MTITEKKSTKRNPPDRFVRKPDPKQRYLTRWERAVGVLSFMHLTGVEIKLADLERFMNTFGDAAPEDLSRLREAYSYAKQLQRKRAE